MLYSFAKILMTAGLRFFFRHIYVTGLKNIPPKGPVIIIANHNSSLMDAALLGILLKRKAWFFARGDVFVNKPIQKILWWFHMMPVHSYYGGRKTLQANQGSFSKGQQILAAGGIIVFFPESNSHTEHQLLPFRKGVFRLAFDTAAAADFSFDIPIVPVGITYDHPVNCRTSVQVHAGKPLLVAAYKDEYSQGAAAALLHICKDAHQAISQLVLHIVYKDCLETANRFITINRNNNPYIVSAWKIGSIQKLEREQSICTGINNTTRGDFQNKKQAAAAYFNLLDAAGIVDKTIAGSLPFPAWKRLLLWIGFPFYLTGQVLNGFPVLVARQIADKKVYRKDFYSWIFVACYSIMYFLWLVILVVTAALFLGWQYASGLLVVMVVTGLFAYVYKDWLFDSHQQKNWQGLTAAAKKDLAEKRKTCRNCLAQTSEVTV